MKSLQNNLSDRERDVLFLIANEFTTPEIAEQLYVSAHTVISHRSNLFRKLNARNIAGLIFNAIKRGELHYH